LEQNIILNGKNECSHLICSSKSPDISSDKYQLALKSKAIIVSKDWVIDSFLSKMRLSVADYLVDKTDSTNESPQINNNSEYNTNSAVRKIFNKNSNITDIESNQNSKHKVLSNNGNTSDSNKETSKTTSTTKKTSKTQIR